MASFDFPKHAKTVAATQASHLFSLSLEFCTPFPARCLAGSSLPLKAQFNYAYLESPADHPAPVIFHHITCSFSLSKMSLFNCVFIIC